MRYTEARETTALRSYRLTICDVCGKEEARMQADYVPTGIIGGGIIANTATSCDHLNDMPDGWYRLFPAGKHPEDFCSLACLEFRATNQP